MLAVRTKLPSLGVSPLTMPTRAAASPTLSVESVVRIPTTTGGATIPSVSAPSDRAREDRVSPHGADGAELHLEGPSEGAAHSLLSV